MDKGTVATSGTVEALKGPSGRVFEVRVKGDLSIFISALKAAGLDVADTDEDVMRVFVPVSAKTAAGSAGAPGDDQRMICDIARGAGVQIRHLKPSLPTLEDVFARAIGEA